MLVRLENAYSRPFLGSFWGTFPPNDVTHRPNPKKDRPWAEPRHLSHKAWISVAGFELGVCAREKGQDRKKSHKRPKGYISPIWGEAPTEAMYMKICLVGDVLDVITCAKFQNKILRGYDFTGGRIFHFPIDFWMGLTTVQLSTLFPLTIECAIDAQSPVAALGSNSNITAAFVVRLLQLVRWRIL